MSDFFQVALSAIVRKVHLLEVCQKLHEDTRALLLHLPPLDDDNRIKEEVIYIDSLCGDAKSTFFYDVSSVVLQCEIVYF